MTAVEMQMLEPAGSLVIIGEVYLYAPYAQFLPAATESGSAISSSLPVPAGAIVGQAVVRVGASAPNRTPISGVATVRSSAGDPTTDSDSMIIDFGVMRNVSGIEGPAGIRRVAPWIGTSFDTGEYREGPIASVDLQELSTERLLVEFDSDVSVAEVASSHVTTSTPPSDLELTVAGTRAWFHQGVVPSDFTEDVDITAAVQSAVSAGVSPVPIVMTARVPGHLELEPLGDVQFLRTHTVAFAQGDTIVVEALEEGVHDVLLPLPVESSAWRIHSVISTITAEDRGPERVDPPIGPAALAGAELSLDPDRRIVVRLPSAVLAKFEQLVAVRVRLLTAASGIGVVGGVLGGTPFMPGAPLPGGEVVEVAVEPSATAEWVTLRCAKPVALPSEDTLWLSIAATRGRAILGLSDVADAADLDDGAEGSIALLRRIAPNGVAKPLSHPTGLRTDALALRLVGTAPAGLPLDLMSVGLAASAPDGQVVDVVSTAAPSDDRGRFERAIVTPAAMTGTRLRITVTAPTRLTIGPVVVAYEED